MALKIFLGVLSLIFLSDWDSFDFKICYFKVISACGPFSISFEGVSFNSVSFMFLFLSFSSRRFSLEPLFEFVGFGGCLKLNPVDPNLLLISKDFEALIFISSKISDSTFCTRELKSRNERAKISIFSSTSLSNL